NRIEKIGKRHAGHERQKHFPENIEEQTEQAACNQPKANLLAQIRRRGDFGRITVVHLHRPRQLCSCASTRQRDRLRPKLRSRGRKVQPALLATSRSRWKTQDRPAPRKPARSAPAYWPSRQEAA